MYVKRDKDRVSQFHGDETQNQSQNTWPASRLVTSLSLFRAPEFEDKV